jgi:hypothetical protein
MAKVKKYAEGAEIEESAPRFDEDTYARARKWMESQGEAESAPVAKPRAAKKAVKPKESTRKSDIARGEARNAAAQEKVESEITRRNPTRSVYGETLASSVDRFINPEGKPRRTGVGKSLQQIRAEEGYAKGGSVKGWGQARGAKQCKMY